jgi:hypothetical protein
MNDNCPICDMPAAVSGAIYGNEPRWNINCPRCRSFQISDITAAYLKGPLRKSLRKQMLLSHAIRGMQSKENPDYPMIQHDRISTILNGPFPKPIEQVHSFVLWVGDHTSDLGQYSEIDFEDMKAEIVTATREGVEAVIAHLLQKQHIELDAIQSSWGTRKNVHLRLTFEGWDYYENLKSGSVDSRKAFMAMQYNDPVLDEVYSICFRPAVQATNFELYRLDEQPKAGLIDDRLRVEIRTSRFLIADLTHQNRGAYWEAGYAEGLGKPVIYTCEESVFDEVKTHFDTNHHTTVKWNRNKLEQALSELKSTIRATLPAESKLTDD